MLKKLFRLGKLMHWQVQEKETIDEVIFRTTKVRNRLMLELMARGGMRVGEVLKLTGGDVEDQKLVIRNPKIGKETEVVFIPKKLADRLKDYLKARGAEGSQRIFPITYTAARVMVKKAGALVGVHLRPHDLRRHAATYASRSGVPVEIVSKVILRHANLSTTQRYLGKVSIRVRTSRPTRWYFAMSGRTTTACGQSRNARAMGIADRTPKRRASYDAEHTTPRLSRGPPTMRSGSFPAPSGSTIRATATKNASASARRIRRAVI